MQRYDLESLTGQLLDHALRAGATEADALAVSGAATSVDVRAGRLEQAERAEGVEIGLRVLIGGRQACVSASDHSPESIAELAHRAVAMAAEAPVDDSLGLADPAQLSAVRDAAGLELDDPTEGPDPATLEQLALRAEAAAMAVSGISQVESASASFSRRMTWLQATNGFSGGYGRSGHAVSAVAITGEGLAMERDWAAESRIWANDMPPPEDIGRLAGERTIARAGARKPPTGAFPILYDRRVSSGLIGHLLAAVNGSSIVRGSSWLRDALDQPVLPAGMNLIEQPHLRRHSASRPFDAEGLATAPRMIVDDGVLTGWTLDLSTARKLGQTSTANASRGIASAPSPSLSNIVLTQGDQSPAALMAQMGRGLLVTSMLGASVNPTTGDYSRGAAGFWIENGEIAYPVNECTIAGNLRNMLTTLIAANDAEDWRNQIVPSLLVQGMTVAGG